MSAPRPSPKNPAHKESHLALGRWKLRTGRPEESLVHIEAVCRLEADNLHGLMGIAKAAMTMRDYVRAKTTLLRLASSFPDEPATHLLLSQVYQAQGDAARSTQQRAIYLRLHQSLITSGGMSSALSRIRPLTSFINVIALRP